MRLGAPVFVPHTNPDAWVKAHLDLGYRAAYVPSELTDTQADALAAAATAGNLTLAEVGAWSNTISSDDTIRKQAIALCCQRLALADRVGACCCVNIAGSRGQKWDGPDPANLSPETFDLIVQVVRQIIDTVQPRRSFYTLETMPWVFPDSPASYLQLLQAIDRPQFAVHLDVVNMVNCPARAYDTAGLIRECFQLLGPSIRSIHLKDIRFTQHLTCHLDECLPGQGLIHFPTLLREASRLHPDTTLMLEHLSQPDEYTHAAAHIRAVAANTGLSFS